MHEGCKFLCIVPVPLKKEREREKCSMNGKAGHPEKPPEHLCWCIMEKLSMEMEYCPAQPLSGAVKGSVNTCSKV